MKIAMISTPFVAVPPTGYGGTELVVHTLTEGLLERGHEVTLFATGDSHSSGEVRHLYEEAQWPITRLTDLNHVSWALGQVASEPFDLVHVHSAEALACARLLPDIPRFHTLHHVREELLSAYYGYFPETHFIAISDDQRAREAPLPKIETIHHGLCTEHFAWTREPSDFVAFIGRFAPVKGAHTAIDVAAAAGVPIRIGGGVHEVDTAFGEAEITPRLSLPHVTFLGTVDRTAKAALLRDARALLFPIEWNEPFGLVLIEAMLSGCPPVAFPRGSVPELIEEGITGFMVRNAEEMVEVLRPGGPLDAFDRRACRERAKERFGAGRMVEAHERYYARALDQRPMAHLAGGASVWSPSGRGSAFDETPEQS